MSPQNGFLCEVNPALGTPRAIHLSISQNSHPAPSNRGRYVLAICGFIPMLQQIKLHQPTHRCLEAAMYTTPARRVNFQVRDQTREYRGAPQQTESKELVKDHFFGKNRVGKGTSQPRKQGTRRKGSCQLPLRRESCDDRDGKGGT